MSFWKGKKVLVTGGMGFVGSFVVSQLLEFGAEVTVTTRRKTLNTKKFHFKLFLAIVVFCLMQGR